MTVIRGTEIGKELGRCFGEINAQIKKVEQDAKRMGVSPQAMRDANGNYVLSPLLAAKAQTLHAIVLINQK